MSDLKLEVGGRYHWKHQKYDRLVYVGQKGVWHQFEKVDLRGEVWCEVLDEHLRLMEVSEGVTPNQLKVLKEMRDAGYAVIVWSPEELGSASPDKVQDRSIELGREVISDLNTLWEHLS